MKLEKVHELFQSGNIGLEWLIVNDRSAKFLVNVKFNFISISKIEIASIYEA